MQLNEIFKWLETDDKNRLEVCNVATEKLIGERFSNEDLQNKHNGKDAYLSNLVAKGVHKIAIQRFETRGSGKVRIGLQHKFGLTPQAQNNTPATQVHNAVPMQQPSLNGGMPGMGYMEMVQMNTKASNYEEAKRQLETANAKIATLEADNKKLERENLKYELGIEGKPGALDQLIERLDGPTIATIVGAISNRTSAQGSPALNASSENLTRIKQEFVKIVSQDNVPDAVIQQAYFVINNYMMNNEKFIMEFTQLITKHNEQNQQANGTSNG